MHPNNLLLEQQPDFSEIESLDACQQVFRVLQRSPQQGVLSIAELAKPVKRVVKVYRNAHYFYALKLQKALLMQADSPVVLHEVRKVGLHYLFVFEDKGKHNLLNRVAHDKPWSSKQAKTLLRAAVSQLQWLHAQDRYHTRIQPSHWVVKKKAASLVGWRHLCESSSVYETEFLPEDYEGLMYCAPERWNAEFTESSEIYSLGLCLYYALTGEHLIEALWQETLKKQAMKTADKNGPAKQAPNLGATPTFWQIAWLKQSLVLPKSNAFKPGWQNLLRWMLDIDPNKRPTLEQLQHWLEDKQMIQSINLSSVQSVAMPADWSPASLRMALADKHQLTAIYETGLQAKQQGDLDYAFNLFENCVFKKHSLSEVALAEMYQVGEPINQSSALAATMYYQAFCKGNPNGAYGLGRLLEKGQGLPANRKHAAILYRFAAMRGLLAAQVALGKLYAKDQPPQWNLARFWLVLAVQHGALDVQPELYEVLQQFVKRPDTVVEEASSLSVNLLEEDTTERAEVSQIPAVATMVNPDKILQLAQGLEAKMEGLIASLPD